MDKLKLLEKICYFPAVSGNEKGLIKFLYQLVKPLGGEVFIDSFGNLICQKGKRPNQLVIMAHVDKIGFMISKLRPKIEAVGLFKDVEDKLKINRPQAVVVEDLSVGSYVSYAPNFLCKSSRIFSQGLDNALGVVAALESLKALNQGSVIFTVQEEMGFYGAKAAAKLLEPEQVIIIDATYADDPRSAVKSGGGVSFCVKDNFLADKTMLALAKKICGQNHLPYQLEVILEGNSDITGVFDICGGLPYLFVGIPINQMHTACESAAMADLETTINFCQLYVKKWGKMK